jgi:hypothetical protein
VARNKSKAEDLVTHLIQISKKSGFSTDFRIVIADFAQSAEDATLF